MEAMPQTRGHTVHDRNPATIVAKLFSRQKGVATRIQFK